MYILSQVIGAIGLVVLTIGMQFREKKNVLLISEWWQTLKDILKNMKILKIKMFNDFDDSFG